jgi:hypothetical protein
MNVDVIYQGLALAKGAPARSEGGGLFVELETPMPVGTRLEVVTPDGTQSGRVESVVEGVGAGMLVGFGAAKTASPPSPAKEPAQSKESKESNEPNAPMAEMKSAPPVPMTPVEAEKDDDGDDDKPEDKPEEGGNKKKKNRKPRKTVIGH